jgi:nucleotide-binding universal stress UspA family protein
MYKRILVPTDGSDTAKAGVMEACKLAKEQGAQVRLVYILEPYLALAPEVYGVAYEQVTEDLRAGGASALRYAQTVAKQLGIEAQVQLIEALGSPAGELIIKAAQEWPADLIVCGTHGRRGLRRIVMGSDAEYIVRHTPVPVLLIRQDDWLPGEIDKKAGAG